MKVLITGGAGFIGSHIAQHFQGKADVVLLDNFRTGFKSNLENLNVELIEASITDTDAIKKAVKNVDYIFHLAAMVSVPESMDNPQECVEINTQGTLNLLKAASDSGVKKLVLSSSSAIYGNNPVLPKKENMYPEPMSPYAITKLDGEYYCQMFNDNNWLNTVSLRYFNVFGPRQNPKSQYAAAIPIFITKAIANEDVTIFGDGQQTRDFVYVKDVVAANAFFAMNDLAGVYNVAYGKSITVQALAEDIVKMLGSQSQIVNLQERPGDVKHSVADVSKLKETGFEAGNTFDAGLQTTIEYFKNA